MSRSPLGYAWSAPNTAIGLALGGLGFVAEVVSFPFMKGKWDFGVSFGNNAIQFAGHNLVGSAITIGSVISYDEGYAPNSYGPNDFSLGTEGHTIGQHELQHTYQGQMVGALYLPVALIGMALGKIVNGDFHGSMSFMERGPQTYGENRPFNFSKDYVSPY